MGLASLSSPTPWVFPGVGRVVTPLAKGGSQLHQCLSVVGCAASLRCQAATSPFSWPLAHCYQSNNATWLCARECLH
eukprot:3532962-Amphidinium_carterae.1